MKITFTLSNLTDLFYDQLAALPDADKLASLLRQSTRGSGLEHCVKAKIATGQFRDAVEFNAMKRAPMTVVYSGVQPRRGYKLLSFDVSKAA